MTKKPYHHGALRKTLLAGAMRLLEDRGAPHLSLREAARMAGVSQTAPYRHFASKEALLAALAAQGFSDLCAAMDKAGGDANAAKALHATGRAYVDFALARPRLFRLMFGPEIADKAAFPDLHEAAMGAYARMAKAVETYLASRRIHVKTPRVPAVTSWSLVHGLASLLIDNQIEDLEGKEKDQLISAVTGFFVTGG
ncbi:MAG TPA: TetR/AcrR family transcriptional regulator [Rhizobiales bacterium]|nr:TetR/AcrR family transcriptional regulator [Hyphomicrobiales bacterium]